MTKAASPPPTVIIRGRSFMALVVAPEPPLERWFEAFDQQMQRSTGFFADRPIIVNLATVLDCEEGLAAVLDGLAARQLRLVGVEGIDPALLAGTGWRDLPNLVQGRDLKRDGGDRLVSIPDDTATTTVAAVPAAAELGPSLLIDRPVRSGQSILFESGDVTIIGAVASGAEVVAGGSIHIYGALRGRAIAGLRTGAAARIFCGKLAAELVAIDGLYHTAEQWGPDVQNHAVQVQLDQAVLKFTRLD